MGKLMQSYSRIFKILYVVTALGFLTVYLFKQFDEIKTFSYRVDYINLLGSMIFLLSYSFNNLLIWFFLTKTNNNHIDFSLTIVLRAFSEIGKYIPGKLWGYGYLINHYKKEGISIKNIAVCSLYEIILIVLSTCLIFIISFLFTNNELIYSYKVFAIILLVVFFIVIHPRIMQYFLNIALKIVKKEPVEIKLDYFNILKLILFYTCNWFIFGFAFYMMINSFYQLSLHHFFYLTGSFALASLAGFFAIFAPAGIGVREGILLILLQIIISSEVAIFISFLSRVWITLSEAILIGLIAGFNKIRKVIK